MASPTGLGQYFSNMVEAVSEKQTKSRAALIEQVKKQFKQQLEASQAQNNLLQSNFTKNLNKLQETNDDLNKNLRRITAENTKMTQDLEKAKEKQRELEQQIQFLQKKNKGCLGSVVGIAAIVTLILLLIV